MREVLLRLVGAVPSASQALVTGGSHHAGPASPAAGQAADSEPVAKHPRALEPRDARDAQGGSTVALGWHPRLCTVPYGRKLPSHLGPSRMQPACTPSCSSGVRLCSRVFARASHGRHEAVSWCSCFNCLVGYLAPTVRPFLKPWKPMDLAQV